jgi:hypothetical protein
MKLKIFSLVVLLLIASCGYYNYFSKPKQIKEAILDVTGFSDFPNNSKIITLDTSGGMFSRQFYANIHATETSISEWLDSNVELTSSANTKILHNFSRTKDESVYIAGGNAEVVSEYEHTPKWYDSFLFTNGICISSSKAPAWHFKIYIIQNQVVLYVAWS